MNLPIAVNASRTSTREKTCNAEKKMLLNPSYPSNEEFSCPKVHLWASFLICGLHIALNSTLTVIGAPGIVATYLGQLFRSEVIFNIELCSDLFWSLTLNHVCNTSRDIVRRFRDASVMVSLSGVGLKRICVRLLMSSAGDKLVVARKGLKRTSCKLSPVMIEHQGNSLPALLECGKRRTREISTYKESRFKITA